MTSDEYGATSIGMCYEYGPEGIDVEQLGVGLDESRRTSATPQLLPKLEGRQLEELRNPAPAGGTTHHQAQWRCKGQCSVDGPPIPFDQSATTQSQEWTSALRNLKVAREQLLTSRRVSVAT